MSQHVNLTTSKLDTVYLVDYLFDQTYGMSDANSILLSFSKSRVSPGIFKVNIAELGLGIGAMKFEFDTKDLESTPQLAIP